MNSLETERLADGLRLAATRPFHVCLLDHNIGYDSGIEALPRLRELAPLMRVIMVTGNSAVDDAVEAATRASGRSTAGRAGSRGKTGRKR